MRYLVTGSEGPGFGSPQEAIEVLEKGFLPTFDTLMKLEAEKKIVAGGLPVGDRSFVFIAEATSNEDVGIFNEDRTDCKPRANNSLFRGLEGGFIGRC